MNQVDIYTDGACRGNPGPGGWGVLLKNKSNEKELFGGDLETTNNKMEMMAAIKALESLKETCQVNLYTDSKYVSQGITEWIHKWKVNNFMNAKKKKVKNADLWVQLDALNLKHQVKWIWVKGHSGDPGNERADSLANKGLDSVLSNL